MDRYVQLAKEAMDTFIREGKIMEPPGDLSDNFLNRKAGVFVTIRKGKKLRGCVGTYLPTQGNLAEEIISNAVAACSKDHRFDPITVPELSQLDCEVSILSDPQLIKDVENHNPRERGIIARCKDGRCGLLLPDLEGIEKTDQQISIACQKGGIDPGEEGLDLYAFTVEKHE